MSRTFQPNSRITPALGFFIIFLFFPEQAAAQPFVICEGPECQLCHIVSIANIILNWLIGILLIVAVFIFIIAGFYLVKSTGNPEGLKRAKAHFINTLIGLILVIASWLIIDTLFRVLMGDTAVDRPGGPAVVGWGPWSRIECVDQPELGGLTLGDLMREAEEPAAEDGEFIPADPGATGPLTGSVTPIRNPDGSIDESALASLRAAGVNVAAWHGIDGPGRTDLAHPEVVAAMVWMQQEGQSRFGTTPFQVTSAYTRGVGHSANSQHYTGLAVDFQPVPGSGVTLAQLNQLARDAGFTYVLTEGRHVHADAR